MCRHRAYPVVTKPQGSSLVIGCKVSFFECCWAQLLSRFDKYHGWSYNAKGDLVKAPKVWPYCNSDVIFSIIKIPSQFQSVEGFDKSANVMSFLAIHTSYFPFIKGLLKVHTNVTPQGFIFLNFDACPNPVPFEDHFANLPQEWKTLESDAYEYVPRQRLVVFVRLIWTSPA